MLKGVLVELDKIQDKDEFADWTARNLMKRYIGKKCVKCGHVFKTVDDMIKRGMGTGKNDTVVCGETCKSCKTIKREVR